MPSPPPEIPREIFRDHARESVRLGLWYVWRLTRDGRIGAGDVERALATRVNLYRRTTLFDGTRDVALGHRDPTWETVAQDLANLVRDACSLPAARHRLEVEDPGLARLDPLLADSSREPRPGPWFGCWSGQAVGPGIADRTGRLGRWTNPAKLRARGWRLLGRETPLADLELHFENRCAPASPFADPAALATSLSALLEDARRRHPELRRVWCNSWLNSQPHFLALFPASWERSARRRAPHGPTRRARGRWNTENWWGQFTDRTGGFRHALAERFRVSGGAFPNPCRLCHASIDDVRAHLEVRS